MKTLPTLLFLFCAAGALPGATSRPPAMLRGTIDRSAVVVPAPSVSRTGVLRNDKLFIWVQPDLAATVHDRMTVVTRDTGTARAVTNVLPASSGPVEVAIQTNKQYVLFSSASAHAGAMTRGRKLFPGTLVLGTAGAQTRSGQLFLEPRQSPLPWNSEAKAFVTKLVVGLDLTNQTLPVSLKPAVTVQFFASHAQVDPESVAIDTTGTGGYREVNLSCARREENPTVVARSDLGELSQEVPVERLGLMAMMEMIFPVTFLFASLLGGALGGFLRALRRSVSSKRTLRNIVEGCIVGLLTVGALAAGIAVGNWSPAVVGRELGAFVIAGLAGYSGVAVLDKLTGRLFKEEGPK